MYAFCPSSAIASVDALLHGVGDIWAKLSSPYGFIYPAQDIIDGLMELTTTPTFPWNRELSPQEQRRKARLLKWQIDRTRIGSCVRGAYWANLLGENIVGQLGGMRRIRGEAPVAEVRPLLRGGALLLRTHDPYPDDGNAQDDHILEDYFRPIACSRAPNE
jgi:hypothetical protein